MLTLSFYPRHTVVIITIIFIFAFSAFATNSELGSPGKVYDALVKAAERYPVEGNAQGSYLTMRSHGGGIFWIINIIGKFLARSYSLPCLDLGDFCFSADTFSPVSVGNFGYAYQFKVKNI